jgi:hypothetical protein
LHKGEKRERQAQEEDRGWEVDEESRTRVPPHPPPSAAASCSHAGLLTNCSSYSCFKSWGTPSLPPLIIPFLSFYSNQFYKILINLSKKYSIFLLNLYCILLSIITVISKTNFGFSGIKDLKILKSWDRKIIMSDNKLKYNVFLSNLPIGYNDYDIKKKFSVFGKVAEGPLKKIEGKNECGAIISFENAEGMKRAVENGVVVLLFSSIFDLIFVL